MDADAFLLVLLLMLLLLLLLTLVSSLTVPVSSMSVCASRTRLRPLFSPDLLVGSFWSENQEDLVELTKLLLKSSLCLWLTISRYLRGNIYLTEWGLVVEACMAAVKARDLGWIYTN